MNDDLKLVSLETDDRSFKFDGTVEDMSFQIKGNISALCKKKEKIFQEFDAFKKPEWKRFCFQADGGRTIVARDRYEVYKDYYSKLNDNLTAKISKALAF